ncbi:hypothetical protein HMPREF1869_00609 [Bacteroidales bacterium KA00251]|nr:hypothetical protein HMPREF1869_00609 [Bacteroidales bacterium KA00251]
MHSFLFYKGSGFIIIFHGKESKAHPPFFVKEELRSECQRIFLHAIADKA